MRQRLRRLQGAFRLARNDVADGHDCVNWMAAQEWCDGYVSIDRGSYMGLVQLSATRTKLKEVKCMMRSSQSGNYIGDYPSGWTVDPF